MRARIVLLAFLSFVVTAVSIGKAASSGVATYFVNVAAPGTVGTSSGVHTVTKTGTGTYDIVFNRGIANVCGYLASITGGTPGFAIARRTGGTTNGITVTTWNKTGVAADLQFTLFLNCAP